MLDSFFEIADADRVALTIQSVAAHQVSRWVLTGGLAIELHIQRLGGKPVIRPLHDIDFIAESFASIPESLGGKLLLSHVHPNDPPGKTLFQAVHPETGVRIDVFHAYGFELERAMPFTIADCTLKVVSLQDLVARHARLNWDLIESKPIAPKYARDFIRLLEYVTTDEIEPIWQEHRKPHFPNSFSETAQRLRTVIDSRTDLLIPLTYSNNVHAVCERCHETDAFLLTDRNRILSILGYC